MNPTFPTFTIFLGDAKTIYLRLVQGDCNQGAPVDLTNCSEIVISLPNQDGTTTVLKLSLSQIVIATPAVLGSFSAAISAEVSALLNVGEFQPLDVTFTILTQVFTVRFQNALSVFQVA